MVGECDITVSNLHRAKMVVFRTPKGTVCGVILFDGSSSFLQFYSVQELRSLRQQADEIAHEPSIQRAFDEAIVAVEACGEYKETAK